MGNLRVSNEIVLAKIESAYGTDPTPTVGANAILVQTPTLTTEGLRMLERPVVRANLNQVKRVYGGKLARLSFPCELKGSGAAGTAPEIGPLLRACGMGETIVGATSVTYKPISTAHESITLWYYEGGRKQHKLNGCRGNVRFNVAAGQIALAEFEFVGHCVDPGDVAIPSPTYNSQVPRPAVSMAISIGGVSAMIVRAWNASLNNSIIMPDSVAAADGYGEVQLSKQDIAGEIMMDAELAATIDTDAQLTANTGLTFGSGTLGSVAGNRITFTGATSGMYWRDRQIGDNEGLRIRTMPFGIEDTSAGNDSLSVVFT